MHKILFLTATLVGSLTAMPHDSNSHGFLKESSHALLPQELPHIHRSKYDLENPGVEGLHFIEGFVKGLLGKDISAIEQCAVGASGIIDSLSEAIHAFAQHDVSGVIQGMTILYNAMSQVPQEFSDCTAIAPELAALEAWLSKFLSPVSLGMTIAKNMIFHSKAVFSDITEAIADWNASDYYNTGVKFGDGMKIITQ